MARGINKAILVGTLGRDPEMKYTAAGKALARVSIATSENWQDKQSGEKKEKTEWHQVIFFGRLAEIAGEYLHKGSQVYIEGKIQTRKWQGQDGTDRYTTEIVCADLQMLGGKPAGTNEVNPSKQKPTPQQRAPKQGPADDEGFDDIPF